MHSMSFDNMKKRSSMASLWAATGCSRSPRLSFGALISGLLLHDWIETSVHCRLVTHARTSELLLPDHVGFIFRTANGFAGNQFHRDTRQVTLPECSKL